MTSSLRSIFVLVFMALAFQGFGQATYNVSAAFGTTDPYPNPGGSDAYTTGFTSLHTKTGGANAWQGPVTLPFAFNFYDDPVTEIYVSDNMLVTFSTPTGTPPSGANTPLPSGQLPDKTIAALWSCHNTTSGGTADEMQYRTFGTAPNRHFVLEWRSYAYGCSGTGYHYNRVVLEEGTNNIYVVEAWNANSTATGTTIGLQNDFTTSVEYSSNYDTQNPGSGTSDQNVFTFEYFNPLPNDAQALAILSPEDNGCGDSISYVLAQVYNKGIDTIQSIPVDATITGDLTGSASTTVGPIAPGDTLDVILGPFNLYDGGNINIEIDIPWAQDDNANNNSISESLALRDDRPAPIPAFDNDTIVCGPASLVLQVPPDTDPAVEFLWFDDLTSTTPAGTGNLFATPTLTQSDTFYVSKKISANSNNGPSASPTGSANFYTEGNSFDVNEACVLDSILVYPTSTGNVVLNIRNGSGTNILTVTQNIASPGPTYIIIDLPLLPGTGYEIDRVGSSVSYEYITNDSYFPFNVGTALTITEEVGGGFFEPWCYLFDWHATVESCPTSLRPFYVEVQPTPEVDLGADTVICSPYVLNAFVPNATSYVWSDGTTGPAKSVNTNQENLSVTVSTSNGCSASDTISIVAPGNPVFTPEDSLTVCGFWQPSPSNLDPTQEFSWSSGDTVPDPFLTTTGTYTVNVINSCGITITDSFYVDVLPGPVVDLGGKDTSICNSNVIQLTTGLPGAPTYLHSWTASNGSNPGSGPNVTAASPNANQPVSDTVMYKVSVGQPGGCSVEDSITVYYLATPVVDLGPSSLSSCNIQTLDAGAFGQGLSYEWSTGATTQAIDLIQSGSYSVTVSSSQGCASSDTILFTKVDSFTVDFGGDQTICNNITQLNTEMSPSAYDFLWNTGATDSSITVGSTGTYSVVVTDQNNGCEVYEEAQIVIQSAPDINLGPDQAICNPPFTLTTGLNQGDVTWSNGDSTHTINVSTAGQYIVNVQFDCGYEAADTIVLNAIVPPTLDIEPAQTAACNPISITTGLGAAYTHQWNTGETTPGITATESGVYIVQVKDVDGCAFSDTTQLVVNAEPNVNLILPDSFPVNSDFLADYQLTPYGLDINWSFGPDALPFANSSGPGPKVVSYPTEGTKTIEVTIANGPCVASASGSVVIYIPSEDTVPTSRPDQDEINRANALTLYPNPARRSAAITVMPNGPLREDLNLDMYDIIGRFVGSYELNNIGEGKPGTIILPDDIAPGVYMIRVNDPNISTQRLIIE